jgi:hypothetical protein
VQCRRRAVYAAAFSRCARTEDNDGNKDNDDEEHGCVHGGETERAEHEREVVGRPIAGALDEDQHARHHTPTRTSSSSHDNKRPARCGPPQTRTPVDMDELDKLVRHATTFCDSRQAMATSATVSTATMNCAGNTAMRAAGLEQQQARLMLSNGAGSKTDDLFSVLVNNKTIKGEFAVRWPVVVARRRRPEQAREAPTGRIRFGWRAPTGGVWRGPRAGGANCGPKDEAGSGDVRARGLWAGGHFGGARRTHARIPMNGFMINCAGQFNHCNAAPPHSTLELSGAL